MAYLFNEMNAALSLFSSLKDLVKSSAPSLNACSEEAVSIWVCPLELQEKIIKQIKIVKKGFSMREIIAGNGSLSKNCFSFQMNSMVSID